MGDKIYLNKHYSSIQESTIAEYLGWKKVSGSGNRNFYPGDIESPEWLGECKTHIYEGSRILIDLDVWDKIQNEAQSKFKKPALFVDDGSQQISNTFVFFKPPILSKITLTDLDVTGNKTFSKTLEEFNALLKACYYQFIVIKHNNSKYCLMPLPIFKQYLGLS